MRRRWFGLIPRGRRILFVFQHIAKPATGRALFPGDEKPAFPLEKADFTAAATGRTDFFSFGHGFGYSNLKKD
jgi:hypothetical protein